MAAQPQSNYFQAFTQPFTQAFGQAFAGQAFTGQAANSQSTPFGQSPFGQAPFSAFQAFAPQGTKAPSFGAPAFGGQNFMQNMPEMPKVDFGALSAIGKRNAEVFSAAMQTVAESAQTIARRNMESFREGVEQAISNGREIFTSQSPEDNISRQTEFTRNRMESTLSNLREISDMATKSGFEAAGMIQQRLSDSFSEIQGAANGATPGKRSSKK